MDDAPSFSIGITQIMSSNNNRVFDHEDVGWAENRSKKLHDPLLMAKVSIEKVSKDFVKYKINQIPAHSLRFGSTYNMGFAKELKLSMGIAGVEKFKNTIFDPYLNIPNCNYQGQITKCLLLLELEQDNIDELHIRHASGNILHFTIKEFAIITVLKCTENVNEFKYPDSTYSSKLIQRYFLDSQNIVNKGRLVQRFRMGQWENNQDALEMAILYFIHTFVFFQLGDANIPIHHFYMVEDGRYQQYPWGQIAFSKLIKSLRQEFTKEKKMYRLAGMPYVLNVWIYECASAVSDEIAVKVGSFIPRICNWRVVEVKPKFGMFMSSIFSQNSYNDIHPTSEEMASLDLPGNIDASHSEHQNLAAKFKPEIKTRFNYIIYTPPKRRKNAHPVKSNVIDVNQPEQSVVQSNKSNPISGVNVHDAYVHSLDPKEPTDKSGIKQVKKYLKKYIDKKFQHLEDLIKLNHKQLMNVFWNPHKQEEEDVDTCKDKEGRKDVLDLPHTTKVYDEANAHKQDNIY
ncbi:hypothetical protein H5410_028895 [Solanum commersonii]|uniref:DUF1985 domain-containing protein n=1 Tax=Solanum commersonii TaxID=4109 RepID=A0A9J5Z376_SOLCO|nr:hypothetical protein H5410_028895 [Solanum commersonii]